MTHIVGSSSEYRGKSNIKQHSDATKRSANDIAVSRLSKAKKDLEVYSQELERKAQTSSETRRIVLHVFIPKAYIIKDAQLTTLKAQLLTERRVDLMLETLAIREKARILRLEEIRAMLVELKRCVMPYI